MDHRRSTPPAALAERGESERAAIERPRYEPPRIVKRRSVVRATGQLFSAAGPGGGGLVANG